MAEPASPTVEATPPPSSPGPAGGETFPEETPQPKPKEVGKKMVQVKVFLLDGSDVVIECERKIKAADLIDRVHTDMDTGEKDFFSLYFYFNNQKIFLDPEKTVHHQLSRNQRQAQPWVLWYGVKFYIPDPSKLKEDYSRYLYALQICRDIKDNRILIDRETATRLTALMLQASLDDYDPEIHKEGYSDEFEDFILIPKEARPENYEAQLVELHKAKAGYTPAQAELEFCDIARRLTRYGYHLFGAQDEHNTLLLVANGFPGISIYRDKEEIHSFRWPNIVKISYKRKKFRIKYHPKDSTGEPNTDQVDVLKLYCGRAPASKRVWKNAVEQHTFFRLSEPDPPSRVTTLFRRGSRFRYSGRTFAQAQRSESRGERDFQRTYSDRAKTKAYKSYAPNYVPSRDSFRREKGVRAPKSQPTRQVYIGKEQPEDQEWVVLDEPPVDPQVDKSRFEQQRVQVNFRTSDGVPEDRFKGVIHRSGGTLEVKTSEEEKGEPSYRLSVVDENSQAVLTSVSLMVDPEEGAELHRHGDSAVVFDSNSLPAVKLNADTITSTTVLESSGREVSTGGVTQSYQDFQSTTTSTTAATTAGAEANAEPAAPALAVDGSEEAIQVDLFVKQEGELLKEVLSATEKEKIEVTIEDY